MFVVEHDEEILDMRLVVVFIPMGHRCGYVGVKGTHPLYGVDYNSEIPKNVQYSLESILNKSIGKRSIIDILLFNKETPRLSIFFDVHGSLTFSGQPINYPVPNGYFVWWFFGFDCGHYGDAQDIETALLYRFDTSYYSSCFDGSVRTKEYVLEECRSLAKQLAEFV